MTDHSTATQPSQDDGDACYPDVCVLLVDDRSENLDVLEVLLERPGRKLLRAASGPEALELLLEHDVALALLDVHMPGMDGFELAELMRGTERTRTVPIIFVTAATPAMERIFRGYEAGAVDFLFKPINAQLLQSKVNVFIELFRRRRQLAIQVEEHKALTRTADLLIGVLSHDLRTPLTAIVMASDILMRSHPADERTLHLASRITSASKRMMRMIGQLLDFAQARVSGHLPVHPVDADMRDLCHGALFEFEGAGNRIQLQVDGDTRGWWDTDRLLQVISNLVGNALQHGEADTPVQIGVDGHHPDTLHLRISNHGAISPERQRDLFSPFVRTSHATQGSGLGLYIVESIVLAHGGAVSVDSRDHQTTFLVALPRRCPESTSGASAPASA